MLSSSGTGHSARVIETERALLASRLTRMVEVAWVVGPGKGTYQRSVFRTPWNRSSEAADLFPENMAGLVVRLNAGGMAARSGDQIWRGRVRTRCGRPENDRGGQSGKDAPDRERSSSGRKHGCIVRNLPYDASESPGRPSASLNAIL